MERLIPKAWREMVLRILKHGRLHDQILVTLRARQDWDAATGAWLYELIECLQLAMHQKNLTGKLVEGMQEEGETYEFWIFYEGQRLYAKVCLVVGQIQVKVISAHRPLKGNRL